MNAAQLQTLKPGKERTATEVKADEAEHFKKFPVHGTIVDVVDRSFRALTEGDVIVNERSGSDDTGYYIRTFTGRQLYWDRVAEHDYCVEDIAHALSMKCRWSGHTSAFYSVAQHSVLVAALVPEEHKLNALLHDASEAYMPDFPSPLKWFLRDKGFTVLSDLEKLVERSIAAKFKLEYPRPACIKVADLKLLATESRDLMPDGGEKEAMQDYLPNELTPWSQHWAEVRFLSMYRRLTA